MEEFKAKKIIEDLESIAAEEGADALTDEIIEECCKDNGVDPEDFRNFICENIDLRKIKELQGLEEISLEKLDQVAGGAQSVKQGIASFLAATSLLGSAANFTTSATNAVPINAKHGTSRQINLKKAVEKDGQHKKKQKQSAWTEEDILKAIGIGSLIVSVPILGWALSPKKRDVPPSNSQSDQIQARYAEFKKLLDESDRLDSLHYQTFLRGFDMTKDALGKIRLSRGANLELLDSEEIKEEIGEENINALKCKIPSLLESDSGTHDGLLDGFESTEEKSGLTDAAFNEFRNEVIKNAQKLSTAIEDVYCEMRDKSGGRHICIKETELWNTFLGVVKAQCKQLFGIEELDIDDLAGLFTYSNIRSGGVKPSEQFGQFLIPITSKQLRKYVELSKTQNKQLLKEVRFALKLSPETLNDNLLQNIYTQRRQKKLEPQGQPLMYDNQVTNPQPPPLPNNATSVWEEVPEPRIPSPGIAKDYHYLRSCFESVNVKRGDPTTDTKGNQRLLTDLVDFGIGQLGLLSKNVRVNADTLFGKLELGKDPRRGIARYNKKTKKTDYSREGLSKESNFVYDLPQGHCFVHDYFGEQLIKANEGASTTPAATFWIGGYRHFQMLLGADEKLGGLNPKSVALHIAGNATSAGGDTLMGHGTLEENVAHDSTYYLYVNSKEAQTEYFLPNSKAMQQQLDERIAAAKKKKLEDGSRGEGRRLSEYFPCAVEAWNKTGIFERGVYSKEVAIRGATHGETINMITTAAADYNEDHYGTYMGPKEDSDGKLTSYKKQLITYWNTILRIAHEHGNRHVVLAMGGGGAYKGDSNAITEALFSVLTEYGPQPDVCWARCFDNIIFASDSYSVKSNLYNPYERTFGTTRVRNLNQN